MFRLGSRRLRTPSPGIASHWPFGILGPIPPEHNPARQPRDCTPCTTSKVVVTKTADSYRMREARNADAHPTKQT